jgi:hypothetical protein
MSYTNAEVSAATAAMDKYRGLMRASQVRRSSS